MTHAEFKKKKYFPSLNGVRAIAVSLVLVNHFAGPQGYFLFGWLGVQIFFVLSGFLITTLLLRECDEVGYLSLPLFYIRRVFRIWPVYYFMLVLLLWQAYNIGGDRWATLYKALPYFSTFMNEQAADTSWRITWTLGIEWKFYLVWPALAFVLARGPKSRWLVAIAACVVLVTQWPSKVPGPYHYTVLLEGAMLAMLMHSPRGYRLVQLLTSRAGSVMVFALFILMQLNIEHLHDITLGGMKDAPFDNLYGLSVCLLIPAVIGNGLPNRLLSSRPFIFVGERSYSLYLIQISVAEAVSGFAIWRQWNFEFAVMVFLAGLVAADVLYRYLEKPMIRVGRRLEEAAASGLAARSDRRRSAVPLLSRKPPGEAGL
jgi:peptidoglycan/LPS O-acetylase OafA/YrhL